MYFVLFGHEMTLAWPFNECDELSETALFQILGPAFNPRYMSISEPDLNIAVSSNKRYTETSFYADDQYYNEKNSAPAWEYNHTELRRKIHFDSKNAGTELSHKTTLHRFIRSLGPCHCDSVIEWIYLGADYFPRYMRSVVCAEQKCYYGTGTCKPRKFTLNFLKRKRGECVTIEDDSLLFIAGENIGLWIWEEKAVNFCCDCEH